MSNPQTETAKRRIIITPKKNSAKTDAADKPAVKPLPKGKLSHVSPDEIVVGERHRRLVGNQKSLARSIAETGMLSPILVDAEMRLVDGQRRLLAAQSLGVKRVPVLIMDLEDPILAYVAANGEKKKLAASEKFALAEEMLERAKDPAWRERALGGRMEAAAGKGRLDEFVAGHVQLSRESLRKIRKIHESAREDEERFGDLATKLDLDGKVDRHYRELQRRLRRGDEEPATAIVLDTSWTALLESGDAIPIVRSANLSALGESGCLLLVPAPLAQVAAAAQAISASGFRWIATLAGSNGEAWAVGILGRGAEVPKDVAALLAKACVQGAEAVNGALESSLGAAPIIVALGDQ